MSSGPRVVVRDPGGWSPPRPSGVSSGSVKGTIRMGAAATDAKARPIGRGNTTAKIVTGLVAITTGMAIFDLWLLGTNF
jgi:hypothetical protein